MLLWSAGDQYLGIVVIGLPICVWKFGILPPQIVDCFVQKCEAVVDCCFSSLPQGLKYSVRVFAASL